MDTSVLSGLANSAARSSLDFLWLELTNQCNLNCVHCYAESGPRTRDKDRLGVDRYLELLEDAYSLGCRRMQFIGGEPTLNRALPRLIRHADQVGYELIEVYTNLVDLSDALVAAFVRHGVAVATSVYAAAAEIHDVITRRQGSHRKTLANIQRLVRLGLRVRVGVIGMKENAGVIEETFEMLRALGVTNVGFDRVREFGRGKGDAEGSMRSLCGNCANDILAVGPDGVVAPCIMAKQWAVGSVLDSALEEIAGSEVLRRTRLLIADATADGGPDPCQPDRTCMPNCSPSDICNPCSPNAGQPCAPNRWCDPSKR